jgi:hypothetical protein
MHSGAVPEGDVCRTVIGIGGFHRLSLSSRSGRLGVYTYDWIENLLGLDIHSVDRVLTEFQNPRTGDSIPLGSNRMEIVRIEPGQVLCFRSDDGNWTWSFVLRPVEAGTRLISRNRFRLPTTASKLGILPIEPGSLVMERKMLFGIRDRAEKLAGLPLQGESK